MRTPALIVILAWSTLAYAHGPNGSHESPAWCGDRVTMLADGGIVIDATLVTLPIKEALVAWSPDCSQIAVVGDAAFVVDAESRAVRTLGALPGGFQRSMRMEGPAPSIRWAPDGKAFGAVGVNATINDMGIVRWELAKGTGAKFPIVGEIKAFAMLSADSAVVVYRPMSAPAAKAVTVDLAREKSLGARAYKDARISMSPIVVGAFTDDGHVYRIDPMTAGESVMAAKADYVQAMSSDGARALALVNGVPAAIDATGTVSTFDGNLTSGSIADEQTGWSLDGTTTIARGDPRSAWLISTLGAKARIWRGLPAGTVEHVALSADGKRAAFLLEVTEPLGKRNRGCDYEGRSRAELWVANIAGAAKPKKLAVVAHLHSCGIE